MKSIYHPRSGKHCRTDTKGSHNVQEEVKQLELVEKLASTYTSLALPLHHHLTLISCILALLGGDSDTMSLFILQDFQNTKPLTYATVLFVLFICYFKGFKKNVI